MSQTSNTDGRNPLLGSRRVRRRLASIEAAAVAGISCAVGWSFALRGLLGSPGVSASRAEIIAYYNDPEVGRYIVLYLQVLVAATIAFLWFVGVVRTRLGDNEPKLFGTVFLGASLLLAGSLFVGAALLAAPAVVVEVGGMAPDASASSLSRAVAAIILSVFAPRIATLVMLSTATLSRATGALPRWLIVLSYVVGVAEFVNVTIAEPTVYVFPAWMALVSVVLLVRRPPHGFELPAQPGRS
jgi:hypothetical protein